MNKTKQLRNFGQSIWLDNITRDILDNGTLEGYIREFNVTGLTSNPTIFDEAIAKTSAYDNSIREKAKAGVSGEKLLIEIALDDLRRAADLFRPTFDATNGVDGWVSMELSPLLAADTRASIQSALEISRQAVRPNLFVKIPGTPEGIPAIEEAIFSGVPINITLLFSPDQYLAAAQAYLRGIERRVEAGLNPKISSVASVFISRWDRSVTGKVANELRNRLGIAIAGRTYDAYCELLDSPRWRKLELAGAHPQRLLWASTGTKDPDASDTLYVDSLAAPDTINTMPEKTLQAFADHGSIRSALWKNNSDAESILAEFAKAGVDIDLLASDLQRDGADAFVKSWNDLMGRIAAKSNSLAHSNQVQ